LAGKLVPRFLKDDSNGILYIGKGKMLDTNHRLGKLINAFNQTEQMHNAGIRYSMGKLRSSYPIEHIKVYIHLCESPRDTEVELLKTYMEEFGELPPFNHSL
jgi:hypothetical protein